MHARDDTILFSNKKGNSMKTINQNASSDKEKEKIVDYLALHLGFYLASWGMYRGSSFFVATRL